MPEPIANTADPALAETGLHSAAKSPKGVLPKNLKPLLYLCAAGLVIAAALCAAGKKPGSQQGSSVHQAPQPVLQDNTDNNAQELKSTAAAAEQKMAQQNTGTLDPPLPNATAAQQSAAAAYGPNGQPVPCVPGQPCAQQQQHLSPAAQADLQLAAKDRELAHDSRFASNLVYTRAPDQPAQRASNPALLDSTGATGPQQSYSEAESASGTGPSSLIGPRAAGDPSTSQTQQSAGQHNAEVNIDSATGQPYRSGVEPCQGLHRFF